MRRAVKFIVCVATAAPFWTPAPARAEGYASPWGGVIFGSSANNGRGSVGIDAGGMGGGIIGGEVDFGYSPSFFGTQTDFGHNTVIDPVAQPFDAVKRGSPHQDR